VRGVGTLTLASEMTVSTSESRSNATNKKNEISEQRDARFPSSKALDAVPYTVSSTLSPPTNWKRKMSLDRIL
jgi:hypothetical protein